MAFGSRFCVLPKNCPYELNSRYGILYPQCYDSLYGSLFSGLGYMSQYCGLYHSYSNQCLLEFYTTCCLDNFYFGLGVDNFNKKTSCASCRGLTFHSLCPSKSVITVPVEDDDTVITVTVEDTAVITVPVEEDDASSTVITVPVEDTTVITVPVEKTRVITAPIEDDDTSSTVITIPVEDTDASSSLNPISNSVPIPSLTPEAEYFSSIVLKEATAALSALMELQPERAVQRSASLASSALSALTDQHEAAVEQSGVDSILGEPKTKQPEIISISESQIAVQPDVPVITAENYKTVEEGKDEAIPHEEDNACEHNGPARLQPHKSYPVHPDNVNLDEGWEIIDA